MLSSKPANIQWSELWGDLGGPAEAAWPTFSWLACRYAEPHRVYHVLNHVVQGLDHLDPHLGSLTPEQSMVARLAVWCHDAVYETTPHSNNEYDSYLFAHWLAGSYLSQESLGVLHEAIMGTRHDSALKNGLAQLVADVDLVILGESWVRYSAYAAAIRSEFAAAGIEQFTASRRSFLTSFLKRSQGRGLFYTPAFRDRHEQVARTNLQRELATLESTSHNSQLSTAQYRSQRA